MKHTRWMVPLVLAGLTFPGIANATEAGEATVSESVAVALHNVAASDTPTGPVGDKEKDTDVPSPGGEDPAGPKDEKEDVPSPGTDDPKDPTPETPKEDPKETTPREDTPATKPSSPGKATGGKSAGGAASGNSGTSTGSVTRAGKASSVKHARTSGRHKATQARYAAATLPATGASTEALAGMAGVTLLAGGGLVALSRQRGVRRPKHLKEA